MCADHQNFLSNSPYNHADYNMSGNSFIIPQAKCIAHGLVIFNLYCCNPLLPASPPQTVISQVVLHGHPKKSFSFFLHITITCMSFVLNIFYSCFPLSLTVRKWKSPSFFMCWSSCHSKLFNPLNTFMNFNKLLLDHGW